MKFNCPRTLSRWVIINICICTTESHLKKNTSTYSLVCQLFRPENGKCLTIYFEPSALPAYRFWMRETRQLLHRQLLVKLRPGLLKTEAYSYYVLLLLSCCVLLLSKVNVGKAKKTGVSVSVAAVNPIKAGIGIHFCNKWITIFFQGT